MKRYQKAEKNSNKIRPQAGAVWVKGEGCTGARVETGARASQSCPTQWSWRPGSCRQAKNVTGQGVNSSTSTLLRPSFFLPLNALQKQRNLFRCRAPPNVSSSATHGCNFRRIRVQNVYLSRIRTHAHPHGATVAITFLRLKLPHASNQASRRHALLDKMY